MQFRETFLLFFKQKLVYINFEYLKKSNGQLDIIQACVSQHHVHSSVKSSEIHFIKGIMNVYS